jgi:hypothetical protein
LHGKGTADSMVVQSKMQTKFSSEEMKYMIENYEQEVAKLRNKLDIWE